MPEEYFGAGAAKAALTGGLQPLTVFKAHESGHPASRTTCALLTQEGWYFFICGDPRDLRLHFYRVCASTIEKPQGFQCQEKFFGTGAAKAAHTGGLRPLTAFKALESGRPASRAKYARLKQEGNLQIK